MYTKDVVCLLPVETTNEISIPRGAKRTELAEKGLIGKVSINTAWNADNVAREITSVFANTFDLEPGELLPFEYLGYIKIFLLKFQFLISIFLVCVFAHTFFL